MSDVEVGGGNCEDDEDILISHYETQIDTQHQNQEDESNNQDEIQQLQYRISQLEHLVISSSIANTVESTFLDPSTTSLSPFGLLQKVGQLESLLASSEVDNQRLRQELKDFKIKKEQQDSQVICCIKDKDIQIKNLEHDLELLTIKNLKNIKTIDSMKDYVNTLPSQHELDEATHAVSLLEVENELIQKRLEKLEVNHEQVKGKLHEKEILYNDAAKRLEELQFLDEAQKLFMQEAKTKPEVEPNLKELVKIQKTQLIRCAKIIQSQKNNLCEIETDRAELLLQISEKDTIISSLQENVKSYQLQLENLNKQYKNSEDSRRILEADIQTLQIRVTESENLIALHRNEMGNLVRLITEIELSVKEMNALVSFCQSLIDGEEPTLDAILGIDCGDDDKEESDAEESDPSHSSSRGKIHIASDDTTKFDVDVEWILERLKSVRDLRCSMKNLRVHVNEIYTDSLSSSACKVQ